MKEVRHQTKQYPRVRSGRSGYPSPRGNPPGRIKTWLAAGAVAVIALTVLALVLALKILFFIAAPLLLAVIVGWAYLFLRRKIDRQDAAGAG